MRYPKEKSVLAHQINYHLISADTLQNDLNENKPVFTSIGQNNNWRELYADYMAWHKYRLRVLQNLWIRRYSDKDAIKYLQSLDLLETSNEIVYQSYPLRVVYKDTLIFDLVA